MTAAALDRRAARGPAAGRSRATSAGAPATASIRGRARSAAEHSDPERSVSSAPPATPPVVARPARALRRPPLPGPTPIGRAGPRRPGRTWSPAGPGSPRPGGRHRRRRRCGGPAARAAAAPEAGALAARARLDPVDRRVGGAAAPRRGRGPQLRGLPGDAVLHRPAPQPGRRPLRHAGASTGPCGSTASGSPPSSPRPSRRPRPAARWSRSTTRCGPPSPTRPRRLAPGAPLLHPGLAPGQRLRRGAPARPATPPPGSRRPTPSYSGTLPDPAGAARRARDARHDRLARRRAAGWCCAPRPRCRS